MAEESRAPAIDTAGRQSTWPGVHAVAAFSALFIAWVLLKPGSHHLVAAVDDVAQIVGPLLVLPLCFGGIPRWKAASPRQWAPVLLGLGVMTDITGAAIWSYYELIRHQATPFPSLDDAAYLATYPLLFLGIMLLPQLRLQMESRARVALDGLMTITAAVTFSWYFILGPTLFQGGETPFAKLVGTAYPASDLLLIVCLLVLSARVQDPSLRPVVTLLSLGLTSIVIADSVFDYQTLHGTYATGELIDLGWPLGDMLICLAAAGVRAAMAAQPASRDTGVSEGALSEPEDRGPVWHSLLPYIQVPLVGLLMLYAGHVRGDELYEPGVYIGGTVLIGLVLLRQILAILENSRLYAQVRAKNQALAAANRQLRALATTDALTGLPTRRAMVTCLDHEIERARRFGRPFTVLFLDLDHFKALNDSCGHSVGDAALREFAALVRRTLRSIDTVGRWGGEEFVALLPETDAETALRAAQRLREALATSAFTDRGLHLTCSIGLAAYPEDGQDRGTVVEMADRAMYAAKALGRNQVRSVRDPAVTALTVETSTRETRADTALTGTIEALAAVVEARDHYTGSHTLEVAQLTGRLALALGLDTSEARTLAWAGRLHDIGKVAVPDAVLNKPGPLSDADWSWIRLHPVIGADVVRRVPALRAVAPLIRAHHERWDGGGYPDGLAGEAIPLGARIVAVADAFCAMTSSRPYRDKTDAPSALAEVHRCAGTQFDPMVVEALERVVSEDSTSIAGLRSA